MKSCHKIMKAKTITFPKTKERKFNPITLKKLLSIKSKKSGWLVEGLIPKGKTIISAHPGHFKSWFLLNLIKSLSTGDKLFNHFKCTKNKILVVDNENSLPLLAKRLRKLRFDSDQHIHFLIDSGYKIDNFEHYCNLMDYVHDKKRTIICFDSFARIHGGKFNENDSSQVAEIFSLFDEINRAGASVILLHHDRKSSNFESQQGMRGSGDFSAAVDCQIGLRKKPYTKGKLEVKHFKLRCAEELPPFDINIVDKEDGAIDFKYLGEHVQVDKDDLASKTIINILKINKKIEQKEIEKIVKLQANVGRNKTIKLLKVLESENKIKFRTGKNNIKIYSIKKKKKIPSLDI